jgi:hypothetical protein
MIYCTDHTIINVWFPRQDFLLLAFLRNKRDTEREEDLLAFPLSLTGRDSEKEKELFAFPNDSLEPEEEGAEKGTGKRVRGREADRGKSLE